MSGNPQNASPPPGFVIRTNQIAPTQTVESVELSPYPSTISPPPYSPKDSDEPNNAEAPATVAPDDIIKFSTKSIRLAFVRKVYGMYVLSNSYSWLTFGSILAEAKQSNQITNFWKPLIL